MEAHMPTPMHIEEIVTTASAAKSSTGKNTSTVATLKRHIEQAITPSETRPENWTSHQPSDHTRIPYRFSIPLQQVADLSATACIQHDQNQLTAATLCIVGDITLTHWHLQPTGIEQLDAPNAQLQRR